MQFVFGEVVLFAQTGKRMRSLKLFPAGDGAGGLPCWIMAHLEQPLLRFSQERIIQTPDRFKVGAEWFFVAPIHLEGQLEQKAGCLCALHSYLLCLSVECSIVSWLT